MAGVTSGVAIRDSKDPDGGRLTVDGDQFGRLLQRIKGEHSTGSERGRRGRSRSGGASRSAGSVGE
ncbi:DUF397 domain-containing protein [Actinomadura physcomitrii]|uniref:DUF397 domain-containing protein n=1 Tax=Actinomadura physcomitrii TaxID=2650748 RepID=UPI002E26E4CA